MALQNPSGQAGPALHRSRQSRGLGSPPGTLRCFLGVLDTASRSSYRRSKVGRPAAATQHCAYVGPQLAQVWLLGHSVLRIEIAAGPLKAFGQADGLHAAGPVTGRAIVSLIDETLDDQH